MSSHGDDEDLKNVEEPANYRRPDEKALEEILKTDVEDESLRKYKETLLGQAASKDTIIVDQKDPRRVIPKALILMVEGRPDISIDLSNDLNTIKKKCFTIKEGVSYRLRIDFYVQREIVTGLRYNMATSRLGVRLDKESYMVGSYGPKQDLQSYKTPVEDAPSGMAARGTYSVKSLFTDEDKNEYLKWEWQFSIKKDWD